MKRILIAIATSALIGLPLISQAAPDCVERKERHRVADASRQHYAHDLARTRQRLDLAAQRERGLDNVLIGENAALVIFEDRRLGALGVARAQERFEQGDARPRQFDDVLC